MRLDLSQLSLAGLNLDLAREKHPEDRICVREATGLAGSFVRGAEVMLLEDVRCAAMDLSRMLLTFGSLTLDAGTATRFEDMHAELRIQHGDVAGSIRSKHTHSAALQIRTGSLVIQAELDVQMLTLDLLGSKGQVRAQRATFRNLRVETDKLSVACPELEVEELVIGWGDPAFRLDCDKARAAACQLGVSAWAARFGDVELGQLHVRAGDIKLERLHAGRVEGSAEFAPQAEAAAQPKPESKPAARPLWDITLLDRLNGNLIADIEVDLSIPILGRRRATHELRLPVENGSFEYMALERGLSRLEDSLLDFAVRDGALVLELNIPLIGQRGRGKPIVLWDLSPEDYRLAEQQRRARLSVMPKLRLANARESEPPPEPGTNGNAPRFALRSLSVTNIRSDVSLGPRPIPMPAVLHELVLEHLKLEGTVHHDMEARGRNGLLRADADRLRATLEGLPLGHKQLGLTLSLQRLEDASMRFVGLRPAQLSFTLSELALESLGLAQAAQPSE